MYPFLLSEAPWKPSFTGAVSRSKLPWHSSGTQQLLNPSTHRCRHFGPVKNRLSFGVTQRGLRESVRCGKFSLVNSINSVRLPLLHPSTMSQGPLASRVSNLEVTDHCDEHGDRELSLLNAIHRHEASSGNTAGPVHLKDEEQRHTKPKKREFCKRCDKATSLCICHHIKTVVENKTSIIILQHPEEKRHHLGSARIALLGLQNVEIINVPEVDEPVSYRIREQVPGSKRSLTGRGGKKAQNLKEELEKKKLLPKIQPAAASLSELPLRNQHLPNLANGTGSHLESSISGEDRQLVQRSSIPPPWISLQPDAGLLFPSEKALDLWPAGLGLTETSGSALYFESKVGEGERLPSDSPSQLIVLDGTWSKAKRIYFENPWLHSLPHYRLPTLQDSRYGRLRREPKPGFISTVESIVLALQLLEPETRDLESLLSVFDSMMEDQLRVVAEKGSGKKYHERCS